MSTTITAGAWTLGSTPPNTAPSTVKRIQYPKDPSDQTPVTGDFRGVLAGVECDTLDPAFTPTSLVRRNDAGPADLYVVGVPMINADNTRVTVWLAGGTVGYEYAVSITVRSLDGQILTRSFIMPVAWR